MSVIGTLAVKIKGDSSNLDKTLKTTSASLGRFAKQAAGVAVAVGAAFSVFAKSTIDTFDRLAKLSVQAGVSVEALSALGYAAELSGVSTDQLAGNLGRLTKGMNDAAQGIGEAKKAFDVLGIDGGSITTADEALVQIAEKFQAMPDGAKKTALAMQLFGRSGMQMIPFLNQGKDGLEEMRKEAELFGAVISTDAAKASEEFNDNLTRLGKILKQDLVLAVTELMPNINEFIGQLIEGKKASLNFGEALITAFGIRSFSNLTDASKVVIEQTTLVNDLRNEYEKLAKFESVDAMGFTEAARSRLNIEEHKLAIYEKQAQELEKASAVTMPKVFAEPPSLGGGDNKQTDKVKEQLDAVKKLVDEYKRERDFQLEIMDSRDKMLGMTQDERTTQESINEVLGATSESLKEIAEARLQAANLGASGVILAQFDAEAERVKELATQYAELAKVQTESSIDAQRQFSYGWQTALNQYAENASNSAQKAGDIFASVTSNMDTAIAKFVDSGKVSFGDLANSIIKDIIRINLQAQTSQLFSQVVAMAGNAISGFFNANPMNMTIPTATASGAGTTAGGSGALAFPVQMSAGGYTGNGGQFEPAGIVHRGEFVLSKAATQRHGLSKLERMNQGFASGGYAGGDMPSSGVNINIKNEAGGEGFKASATVNRNESGLNVDVIVRKVIANDLRSNGQIAQQMGSTFGLRRKI